jgi:hypothetical protein
MNKDFNVYKWRRDHLTENESSSTFADWKQLWDRHDKTYQYSDDSRAYARGKAEAEELHKVYSALSSEDKAKADEIKK